MSSQASSRSPYRTTDRTPITSLPCGLNAFSDSTSPDRMKSTRLSKTPTQTPEIERIHPRLYPCNSLRDGLIAVASANFSGVQGCRSGQRRARFPNCPQFILSWSKDYYIRQPTLLAKPWLGLKRVFAVIALHSTTRKRVPSIKRHEDPQRKLHHPIVSGMLQFRSLDTAYSIYVWKVLSLP